MVFYRFWSPPGPRPNRRVRLWAGPLLVVALAAGCDVDLYHDLPERRVSEALLALRTAGIRADRRIESRGAGGRGATFALTVPRGDETRALAYLADRGLPRLPDAPAAGGSKLLLLPSEQRTAQAAAQGAALTDTLERLPEVEEARVHLALPDAEPLAPTGSLRPTASVLLRLRAPLSVRPAEIAALVAHAVAGLDPADVTVLSTQAASPIRADVAPMATLGPLRVATDSRPAVLFLLCALAVLTVTCGGLTYLAWPRRRPVPSPDGDGPLSARRTASPPA